MAVGKCFGLNGGNGPFPLRRQQNRVRTAEGSETTPKASEGRRNNNRRKER